MAIRTRLGALLAGLGLMMTSAAAPAYAAVGPVDPGVPTAGESFERDMGGWQPDTDGRARAWKIYRTTDQAVDGTVGLGLYLDGSNDEGKIWIERKFAARPDSTVTVSVSFWLHSTGGGDVNAWGVLGSAGNQEPRVPDRIGWLNQRGWNRQTFTRTFATDGTGTVWVAVGIWATYEVTRTSHLDLVDTTIRYL
jgi:hypothetical protein